MTPKQRQARIAKLAPAAEEWERLTNEAADDKAEAEAKALIGRYFKYVGNCYSGGSPRWNVYYHFTSKDGTIALATSFQNDKQGRLSLESEKMASMRSLVEISRREYNTALAAFIAAINEAIA